MFNKEKEYSFLGKIDLIEDFEKKEEEQKEEEKLYLGKFIEYIPTFYVKDLLMNGKARFEYGILSCGHYKYCQEKE